METTVLYNQSFLDVAIQHTGTVANIWDVAIMNNKNPSEFLASGTSITIPEAVEVDKDVLKYFQQRKIAPGTGYSLNDNDLVIQMESTPSIGQMQIGSTFTIY